MRKLLLPLLFAWYPLSTVCQEAPNAPARKHGFSLKDTTIVKKYLGAAEASWNRKNDSALFYIHEAHQLSSQIKWTRGQAESLMMEGSYLWYVGNQSKGLAGLLESIQLFDEIHDTMSVVLGLNNIGLLYLASEDYPRSITYLKKANVLARAIKFESNIMATANNIGDAYIKLNETDSALTYYNENYQLSLRLNDSSGLGWTLRGFSSAHLLLKEYDLALAYSRRSLHYARMVGDPILLTFVNYNLAKAHLGLGNRDSSIIYARKSLYFAKSTEFLPLMLDSYRQLSQSFEVVNDDSAYKYLQLAYTLRDSLYSEKRKTEIANITLNEEERQRDLALKKKNEIRARNENIQYASIGIGLLMALIVFAILSQSVIVKSGLVKFLGVLALLLVFEFINLLLHPIISDITYHSPAWTFLILVCVAALLVPAHHKLEQWIIRRLVEKNKRIRLAAAKRTIASLESS